MASHIRLNKFLGFGRFRYMTGAQVLRTQDGLSYLRWAHHSGIVIDGEILFQIGLHPSQTNPKTPPNLIPLTPELVAEAMAHEDQLNGVTHEEINQSYQERPSHCRGGGPSGGLHDTSESERERVAKYWAVFC